MIKVNAMGEACPLPVVKTKKALDALPAGEKVLVLVDNKTAVENVKKLAQSRKLAVQAEEISSGEFHITIGEEEMMQEKAPAEQNKAEVGKETQNKAEAGKEAQNRAEAGKETTGKSEEGKMETAESETDSSSSGKAPEKRTVVAIGSACMGEGDQELGALLMKGYIYALTQLDVLPSAVLFYNSGVNVSCEGSVSIADLKYLEEQGTEILSCGTCLNYYGLTEKLAVGSVTNMYVIADTLAQADLVIRP